MLRDWASLARGEPYGGDASDGGSLRSSSSLGSLWDREYGSRLERYRSVESVPTAAPPPVRRHNPVAQSRSCGALGPRRRRVSHDSLEPAELSLDSVTLDECLLLLREEDEDGPRCCCKSTQTEPAAVQHEPSTQTLLLEIVDLMKMLARGPRFQQRRLDRQTKWRGDHEEFGCPEGNCRSQAAAAVPPVTGCLQTGWTHEADSGIASDSCPSPAPTQLRRKPSDAPWPVQRSRRSELFPADSFRSLPDTDQSRTPRTLRGLPADDHT